METRAKPAQRRSAARAGLTRTQVLETGLRFVDAHGLEALSMRRLGAELGVEAMALYNHVGGKDALLDGLVELLWLKVEADVGEASDWRASLWSLARALRGVIHRHARAAPLLFSRKLMPIPALRVVDRQLRGLRAAGCPEDRAAEALQTLWAFALGYATMEMTYYCTLNPVPGEPERQRLRRVVAALPADTPDSLVDVALTFCTCDGDAVFAAGVQTIVRDLDTSIGNVSGSEPALA